MHTTIIAPTCPLPECNLTVMDVEALLPALEGYVQQFASTFARSDQLAWTHRYLQGLLDTLPRKSCEPMALALGVSVRGMQSFIAESPWPTAPVLAHQQRLVAQSLGAAKSAPVKSASLLAMLRSKATPSSAASCSYPKIGSALRWLRCVRRSACPLI
jgi:hypothetical protein